MKIYDDMYWKEHCFALNAEGIVDKAVELKYVAGVCGGNRRPSEFMCLLLKMLQIQPEKSIILEFILNDDYKYVRVLGAVYLRLTGKPTEIYQYLEPLLSDLRKVRYKNVEAKYELNHVDEIVDNLLVGESAFDIALPRLPVRWHLEKAGKLQARKSALEEMDLWDDDNKAEDPKKQQEKAKFLDLKKPKKAGENAAQIEWKESGDTDRDKSDGRKGKNESDGSDDSSEEEEESRKHRKKRKKKSRRRDSRSRERDRYQYLEPLLSDLRKVRYKNVEAKYDLNHIDEIVDNLLIEESAFDIALPRLPARWHLEEAGKLQAARESALEEMDLLWDDDVNKAEDPKKRQEKAEFLDLKFGKLKKAGESAAQIEWKHEKESGDTDTHTGISPTRAVMEQNESGGSNDSEEEEEESRKHRKKRKKKSRRRDSRSRERDDEGRIGTGIVGIEEDDVIQEVAAEIDAGGDDMNL
eukprot:CAMPEP_0197541638 /NCGR_PEP_ID=MMETSP1318-20131121/67271_1 /TAXON_ID=552666 /ORGANISM="Partenskyella glossopodia, Strain RCC365" /LENGTH=467 /DNA_ID=CAMNT_0043100835 /DNA_START=51 /DNA_END=1456 /DNA_ORIENTATION=+